MINFFKRMHVLMLCAWCCFAVFILTVAVTFNDSRQDMKQITQEFSTLLESPRIKSNELDKLILKAHQSNPLPTSIDVRIVQSRFWDVLIRNTANETERNKYIETKTEILQSSIEKDNFFMKVILITMIIGILSIFMSPFILNNNKNKD